MSKFSLTHLRQNRAKFPFFKESKRNYAGDCRVVSFFFRELSGVVRVTVMHKRREEAACTLLILLVVISF